MLQSSSARVLGIVDTDHEIPFLRPNPGSKSVTSDLNRAGVRALLYDANGQLVASLGNSVDEMPGALSGANSLHQYEARFSTVDVPDKGKWRLYTQSIMYEGTPVGYLEVGQPIVEINAELGELFTPVLIGAFLTLLLAVLGGFFLANRALSPIDQVTRTAQTISTHDLSRRINYLGPSDEVGRLAKTFDLMLERLEKGFEQERRFISDASHELRTPLTALKGRLEVTLSRPRTYEDYQQTLTDMSGEVDRLINLSNSLLYLARLDQADSHWQSENLNLSDLLDSTLDSLQAKAELKKIKLSGNIPPDIHVQGNFDQLTRLFLNLVDNAIKYTHEDGSVRVELKREAKKALISVSDTGPGIASKHLPHLFKRFYRVEADRATTSGGTGLGLAIAYEIVRQHGGKLWVESQVGEGSTFKVELPAQVEAISEVVLRI